MPSFVFAYVCGVLGNWGMLSLIYSPEMGLSTNPFPGALATFEGLFVGLLIPFLSSLVPIQRVMDMSICQSMSKTRNKLGSVITVKD